MKKFISFLLVFVLVLFLLSFSAFAASAYTIDDSFSFYSYSNTSSSIPFQRVHIDKYDNASQWYTVLQGYLTRQFSFVIGFPAPSSGSISWDGAIIDQNFDYIIYPSAITSTEFLSSSGSVITSYTSASSIDNLSFSDVTFIRFTVSIASSDTHNTSTIKWFAAPSFSNLVISSSSGSSGGLDQDILDGITAIAQSLLALETGPYYGVSGVTVDANGDLQHTLTQNASLEDLLNALGIAGTDSNHILRGVYNNFGSYFTCYDINDSTSSTTQIYRGLPQYVNALGQSLTDGINRLQRDNNLLYNSISSLSSSQSALNTTLQDALYEETDSSPAENWSVAKWLKGIYDSISGFFTNFWSPAETDLKSAAEPGMQAAADNGLVASSSDVDSMNDIGNAFSSFASFPNVDPMDAVNILSDSDYYRFWTQETEDDLLRHDLLQSRGSKSSGSEVEYVDVLSDHLRELHSILGVNVDGK